MYLLVEFISFQYQIVIFTQIKTLFAIIVWILELAVYLEIGTYSYILRLKLFEICLEFRFSYYIFR